MTTHYLRTYTPATPPVVELQCELICKRRPADPRSEPVGYYSGPPTPDDIRGHLDAQTAEYRAEAIVGVLRQITLTEIRALLKASAPQDFESAEDMQRERDSLKSQLSAAIAETKRVNESWSRTATVLKETETARQKAETELVAARETIRTLEMSEQNHVRSLHGMQTDIERLRDEGAAAEKERDAARETIRQFEQERDSRAVVTYSQEHFIERCAEIRAESQETIHALTEERDRLEARAGVDANRIRRFESREAPGEEKKS